MLGGLCQAFAGCSAATFGAETFYSHAFIQRLAQRRTSAAAKPAVFIIPPNQYNWTESGRGGSRSQGPFSSAPFLLAALSLFPSKDTSFSLPHLSGSDDI